MSESTGRRGQKINEWFQLLCLCMHAHIHRKDCDYSHFMQLIKGNRIEKNLIELKKLYLYLSVALPAEGQVH